MDTKKAETLIDKFTKGNLNPEEEAILDSWYLSLAKDDQTNISNVDLQAKKSAVLSRLDEHYKKRSVTRLWPRIVIVAAAIAVIAFGIYFFTTPGLPNQDQNPNYANDISPGKNIATLTLANGKTINLSDRKTGVVIADGQLSYNDQTAVFHDQAGEASFPVLDDGVAQQLTATTPRGGTYQITLPDGTRVWMNADSKISFPSQFSGNSRKLQLLGEAYFEVAKDKKRPFVVVTDKQEIEVLGTHFNVNSYADNAFVLTTLLEGSVRVGQKGGSTTDVILKPGQQSIMGKSGQIRIRPVDTDEVMAWQKGLFMFDNEQLESIMKRVARWYSVEVVYEDDVAGRQAFSGSVTRFNKVSSLLRKLEKTGPVKFRVVQRKVYVSRK